MSSDKRRVISLFSGALGLDLGLEAAGFEIAVAVECNKFAVKTIKLNRPDITVIEKKLENVPTKSLLREAGLKPGEADVVAGGPSCQSFSTVGQRESVSDPRGKMFHGFLRVVRGVRPRFFVMENVRGVLSAAVCHRPLNRRGPGYPPLLRAEELGSAFVLVLKELKKTGYYVTFGLLNAADYGVPQRRERLVFIGSRDGEPVSMPPKTHVETPTDGQASWVSMKEALDRLEQPEPLCSELCRSKKSILRKVSAGGNWRDLTPHMQEKALGAAFKSWGGRVGFFRRLAWDRPTPALTTRPDSKATMLIHPDELRPLSVQEYARVQQFPGDWEFSGGVLQKYKQIGNAVPVGLGRAIGEAILAAMRRKMRVRTGVIVCEDENLVQRLANRPRSILNPKRMRRVKGTEAAKRWMNARANNRAAILDYVQTEIPWKD